MVKTYHLLLRIKTKLWIKVLILIHNSLNQFMQLFYTISDWVHNQFARLRPQIRVRHLFPKFPFRKVYN